MGCGSRQLWIQKFGVDGLFACADPVALATKRVGHVPFTLGTVGHFGLAVADPRKSAQWWERAFGLKKEFEFDGGVAIGNENVTIALHKGRPAPQTLDHMSFHLPNLATLRKALAHLQRIGAEVEDPGDEIGPEAPGSPHLGLWLHDPDGYRWELSVQNARRAKR